jgi:hypothetical protein
MFLLSRFFSVDRFGVQFRAVVDDSIACFASKYWVRRRGWNTSQNSLIIKIRMPWWIRQLRLVVIGSMQNSLSGGLSVVRLCDLQILRQKDNVQRSRFIPLTTNPYHSCIFPQHSFRTATITASDLRGAYPSWLVSLVLPLLYPAPVLYSVQGSRHLPEWMSIVPIALSRNIRLRRD